MITYQGLVRVMMAFAFLLLAGCSTLVETIKDKSGANVQAEKSAQALRVDPVQSVTMKGNVTAIDTLYVAPFNLPEPLPPRWEKELVDLCRVYTSKRIDGEPVSTPFIRWVERALLYDEDGKLLEVFEAFFDPELTMFFVRLPPDRATALRGHMVIMSSDSRWLMTGRKKMVTLPVGQDLRQLPPGFFREYPSDLRQVVLLKSPDAILSRLKWRFPEQLYIRGELYSGVPDTRIIIEKFTPLNTGFDKAIVYGSLGVTSLALMPWTLPADLLVSAYKWYQQEQCRSNE